MNVRVYSKWSVVTLSRAPRTSRETLKRSSGFMMPGRGNTQDAFLPAEISHVQTSLLKRKKKKKLLNSFCSRSFRCSDRPSLHQEDSKSEREKLFLVNWRRRRRRRSGGGARHLGKFSGEACHSSHHHFSPSTTTTATSSSSSSVALNSSAVSLLPQAWSEHCEKKEKKEKRKEEKEAARSCRNEKGVIPHSCHNLDGGWRNASAEVPPLTARKDQLPKSKCFFWETSLLSLRYWDCDEWWAEV